MRDAAINLQALPEQRDLIDHAASLLGKNRSDFMLEEACERSATKPPKRCKSCTGTFRRVCAPLLA